MTRRRYNPAPWTPVTGDATCTYCRRYGRPCGRHGVVGPYVR